MCLLGGPHHLLERAVPGDAMDFRLPLGTNEDKSREFLLAEPFPWFSNLCCC